MSTLCQNIYQFTQQLFDELECTVNLAEHIDANL
jgi:hypothetical protein